MKHKRIIMKLLLVFGLILSLTRGQHISPLPDGLLVEKGSTLLIEEGLWTVLVTLQDTAETYGPREVAALHRMVTTLRQRIDDLPDKPNELVTTQKRQTWIQRLDLLLQNNTISFNYKPRRTRRGLIDVGGTILNKVFGVATEKQIEQVRSVLKKASQQEQAVIHHVNQLITIVNSTRIEERQTRQRVNALINEVQAMHEEEYTKWQSFNGIAKALMIDELLSTLEAINFELYREIQLDRNIKEALENEQLTEDIFPVSLLADIASKAETFSLRSLRPTWYYEHIKVRPYLIQDTTFVYQIQLPFVGRDDYLRYHIRAWPVPINGSGYTVRLRVKEDVAFHTTEGYLLQPKRCVGYNPQVCRTGPLYLDSTLTCERGIITAHPQDRKKCEIDYKLMDGTKLYEINRGHYVIQTTGEIYTISCRGERQIKDELKYGTYEVVLRGGCSISGDGWMLKGERLQFINVSAKANRIQVRLFNLTDMIPEEKYLEFNVAPLEDVPVVTIKYLDEKNINYDYNEVAHHLSWTNILLILMIMIVLIIIGQCVYRKRDLIRFYFRPAAKPNRKTDQLPLKVFKQPNSGINEGTSTTMPVVP